MTCLGTMPGAEVSFFPFPAIVVYTIYPNSIRDESTGLV